MIFKMLKIVMFFVIFFLANSLFARSITYSTFFDTRGKIELQRIGKIDYFSAFSASQITSKRGQLIGNTIHSPELQIKLYPSSIFISGQKNSENFVLQLEAPILKSKNGLTLIPFHSYLAVMDTLGVFDAEFDFRNNNLLIFPNGYRETEIQEALKQNILAEEKRALIPQISIERFNRSLNTYRTKDYEEIVSGRKEIMIDRIKHSTEIPKPNFYVIPPKLKRAELDSLKKE